MKKGLMLLLFIIAIVIACAYLSDGCVEQKAPVTVREHAAAVWVDMPNDLKREFQQYSADDQKYRAIAFDPVEGGRVGRVCVAGDTIYTRMSPYAVVSIWLMLRNWDAYNRQCYADSTYAEVWQSWDNGKTRGGRLHKFYRHQEPTLSGFMEYLNGEMLR